MGIGKVRSGRICEGGLRTHPISTLLNYIYLLLLGMRVILVAHPYIYVHIGYIPYPYRDKVLEPI